MNEHFEKLIELKFLFWLSAIALVLLLAWQQLINDKTSKVGQGRQELLATNSTDALSFSPDSTMLAGGHGLAGAELRIWRTKDNQLLHEFRTGHDAGIGLVAFSPDGKTLVTTGRHDDGRLLMWDVQSGKLSGQLAGEQWITNSLFFSPDGKYLINSGHGKNATIEIWNAETKGLIRTLKESKGDIFAAIRPDGKTILSVGTGIAKTWNLQTGKLLKAWSLRGKSGAVGYVTVSISPNTKIVAFGKSQRNGRPEMVELWDVKTGKLLHTLIVNKGYSDTVVLQAVNFSMDSKTLAVSSAGENEGIKLWDVQTGKLIHTFTPNAYSLTFSPNGNMLAAGSVRQVYIWNVSTSAQ